MKNFIQDAKNQKLKENLCILFCDILIFTTHLFTLRTMTSMLEYFKVILRKVSFDRSLFEKELRKAISRLVEPELSELKAWCFKNFSVRYRIILKNCFQSLQLPGHK